MKTRLAYVVIGCMAVAIMMAVTPGCRKDNSAQEEEVAKDNSTQEELTKEESAKDDSVQEESTKEESTKEEVEVKKDTGETAAVEAKLAKADAFDGETDKVVSKCSSCALGMDGNSEYALEILGYKLHFCSEDCKTGFEKDTTKAILALKIP